MSNSIDTKVVEAKFDNRQFEQGVTTTLSSLNKLKNGLKLHGATSGLDEMSKSVDHAASRFSILRVAGYTAIASITRQLLFASEHVVSAFTIDPIKEGFKGYQDQINATKTILSNVRQSGASLKDVTKVLSGMQRYAQLTVYNFADMAKNVGTFTANGVGLKQAAGSIKGIANLAAMSGASSSDASRAMYQLSQAIGAGRVQLQDWNSVQNANIGTNSFKNALANTAVAMGTLSKKAVEFHGKMKNVTIDGQSFRNALRAKPGEEPWLTSKVLTNTLQQFTGTMKVATLVSEGFTRQQAKAIVATGKVALNAATQVKTFGQLTQALKEEVAGAYSRIFKALLGNLPQATKLFSELHTTLENFLTNPLLHFAKILQGWSKLGGRTALIVGIKDAFKDLGKVVAPIKKAFREIFPKQTAQSLLKLTDQFRDFFKNFKIGAKTADNLKRTFAGLFAVLDIGWTILKDGVKFILELFGAVAKGNGSGGFLAATAHIGDWLVALDKAIKKGQGLTKFFNGLLSVLKGPINFLKKLAAALFSVFNFKVPSSSGVSKALDPLGKLGQVVATVWSNIIGILKAVWKVFEPLAGKFEHFISNVGSEVSSAVGGLNFSDVLHTINTGLFGGLTLLLYKFVKSMKGSKGASPLKGIVAAIQEPFLSLTETLEEMQRAVDATILLEIAAAVGILTASLIGISHVKPQALSRALAAITLMFGQLFASLISFNKIGGEEGLARASAGLILLAVALRVLTSSVVKIGKSDWKQLSKGLAGVTALLIGLGGVTQIMSTESGGMIATSAGLILLATGIRVLVNAVTKMSNLSWTQLAKGLTGVSALLAALSLYTQFQDVEGGGILAGAGIILLATGIRILVKAIQKMGDMSWKQIAKGVTALAGALTSIASALDLMPPSSVLSAAAILIVAASLGMITDALVKMGAQSWTQIAKGLVTLAGSLSIIASALDLMETALPGAAALIIVAASLRVLVPALKSMGNMSWTQIAKGLVTLAASLSIIAGSMVGMMEALPGAAALLVVSAALVPLAAVLKILGTQSWGQIAKGLVTLAAALTIFGVAGYLLTPVAPTLLALGLAIGLFGAGLALAGAGVLAFSAGLTALSISGAAGAAAISAILLTIVGTIPAIGKELGLGIIAFAKIIGDAGPAIVQALVAIISSLIKAVDTTAPELINAIVDILQKILKKFKQEAPRMADEFLTGLTGILRAIDNHTPQIVHKIDTLVIKMINTMSKDAPKFVTAGANLLVKLINGLSKDEGKLTRAGANLIIKLIQGIAAQSLRIGLAALETIIQFTNALATAINQNIGPLRDAGIHIAEAMINGLTLGLAGGAVKVAKAAIGVAKGAFNGAKHWLGIGSPSKKFMVLGSGISEGLAKGIKNGESGVTSALQNTRTLIQKSISDSENDIKKFQEKIKQLNDVKKGAVKNTAEIDKLTHKLDSAKNKESDAKDALKLFNNGIDEQKKKLKDLAKQYDVYVQKLSVANDALKDAKQTRDDFASSIKDQFSVLPDITVDSNATSFTNDEKAYLVKLKNFIAVLAKLRKEGLSDTMYQELLAGGVDDLPLAESIQAGGQAAIDQVDSITSQITKAAAGLGKTASTELYQAGVDAAQGIVDGLKKHKNDISNAMQGIVDAIIEKLDKELGIKSPVKKTVTKIGKHILSVVSDSMTSAVKSTNDATGTIKKSLSSLSESLPNSMELSPVITPVLDLSSIEKAAPRIAELFGQSQVAVNESYLSAQAASAGYQANKAAGETQPVVTTTAPDISFTQNNYSPKALSPAEIYRKTNNQISQAKGVLKDVAPVG